MRTYTRRGVLAALPAVGCGLAGCVSTESGSSVSSRSTTEGPGRNVPDEQAVTDPPTLFRRADSEQPPLRLTDAESEETNSRAGVNEYHPETTLVDSASMADRLVDETADYSSGGTDLASFVSATDFDSESLYLETREVEQCFRLSLCHLSWESNEIRTDYGRQLRPYDEQCAADENVFESRLFRLPVALDAEKTRGHGSSIRSGRCRRTDSTEPQPRMNSSSQSDGSASK